MPTVVQQLTSAGWRALGQPPSPEPPAVSMLVGATCYHPPLGPARSWEEILGPQVGPLTIRRCFQGASVPASWEASEAGFDVGVRATMWSTNPPPAAFAAGDYDTRVKTLLSTIPDDGLPKIICGWHEADAKVRRGQYSRGDYLTAVRRLADLVHDAALPNVYFASCMTSWLWDDPKQAAGHPDQWWLDGVFDVWTVDSYQQEPPELLEPARTFAADRNIPWAVAETGKTDVADTSIKARWITDVADWCATHGSGGLSSAAFLCWFDSNEGFDADVADQSFTPTSSPASIRAADEAAARYYHNPLTWSLPRR